MQLKKPIAKTLLLLHLFLTTFSIHSMYLPWFFKEPTSDEISKKFIREFPIMTFKNACRRYGKCSDETRAKIESAFANKDDDLLLLTFLFATKFSSDTRREAALCIFENNETATKKFLSCPIKDSCLLYAWAKEVHNGNQNTSIPASLKIKSVDLVFQLSNEIKRTIEIIQQNNSSKFYVGKKDINILQKIIQNSQAKYNVFADHNLQYRYYNKYNPDALKFTMIPVGAITLLFYIPLSLGLASKKIETHFCNKIILDPLLESKIQKLINIVHECGKLSLLDAIRNPQDNIAYPLVDQLKINAPFLGITPIAIALDHYLSSPDSRNKSLAIGVGIAFTAIAWICSLLPFEELPHGFLDLYIAIPTFVFAIAFGIIYTDKTHWFAHKIDWKIIDEELTNDSIFISNESSQA